MNPLRFVWIAAAIAILAGCRTLVPVAPQSGGDGTSPPPKIEIIGDSHFTPPSGGFVSRIDNPFFPLEPGTVFEYVGMKDSLEEINRTHVTYDTRKIMGVECVAVLDSAYVDGMLVEATTDWYAQDTAGNVWYFGEDTKEFNERGKKISKEGSWRAGVRHALPGIIMEAHPAVGDKYQQEQAPGIAEDRAEVLSTTAEVTVPYGSFTSALQTRESTPLDPGIEEDKYYASGVGFVRSIHVSDSNEFSELVRTWKE